MKADDYNAQTQARVKQIDQIVLAPIVQQILEDDTVAVDRWQMEQLHGGTFGLVYRFWGEQQPWSVVLKIVRDIHDAPIPRSDPADLRYWKREPLVYGSDLLKNLNGDFRVAHCYAIVEQTEKEVWLWLEDMVRNQNPKEKARWTHDQYTLVAYHLGQFNGEFLTSRPLPTKPWIGQNLLVGQFQDSDKTISEIRQQLDAPQTQGKFPADVNHAIVQLWDEQERFVQALNSLPQTLSHRDIGSHNAFIHTISDNHQQTVAIDWEDVVIGPIGEDLVSLIVLALAEKDVTALEIEQFDKRLFDAYITGLRTQGWTGDESLVRLGYTAACLRYGLALPQIFLHQELEEEALAQWVTVLRFVFERVDEARRLMDIQ